MDDIQKIIADATLFEKEAHSILARCESSHSRLFSVDDTRKRIKTLSLNQNELLLQALQCIEGGLYRASIVMSWVAFIDYLENKMAEDGLVKLFTIRTKWTQWKSIEEIRENIPEHQLIDAAKDLKLLTKGETKIIHGLLSKRNECAHPGSYCPRLNDSLGYISELLERIIILEQKHL